MLEVRETHLLCIVFLIYFCVVFVYCCFSMSECAEMSTVYASNWLCLCVCVLEKSSSSGILGSAGKRNTQTLYRPFLLSYLFSNCLSLCVLGNFMSKMFRRSASTNSHKNKSIYKFFLAGNLKYLCDVLTPIHLFFVYLFCLWQGFKSVCVEERSFGIQADGSCGELDQGNAKTVFKPNTLETHFCTQYMSMRIFLSCGV